MYTAVPTRLFFLTALFALLALSMGCTATAQCTQSEECDEGLYCVDQRCQSLDDLQPGDGDGDGDGDPNGTDCRVESCEDGLLCNESTGQCQNCTLDEECEEYAVCHAETKRCTCRSGFARCDGQCISQDSVESCGSDCVPCPQVDNGRALCLERSCGVECDEDFHYCDNDCDGPQGQCVECTANSHCTDPQAPLCAQGTCSPCTGSQDCAHLADHPVCHADSGACVQCTPEDLQACDGHSCHPETNQCTETTLASLTSCQACHSDSECAPDHHCVPMEFAGTSRDSAYCLKLDSAGCDDPFTILVIKESVSGADMEIYCGINEELTTCEAVLDYGRSCSSPDDCGHPDLNDGFCEAIEWEFSPRCTYGCQTTGDPDLSDGCDPFYGCEMTGTYCGGF